VAKAFSSQLVNVFCELRETENTIRFALLAALKENNLEAFFSSLNSLFAKIPSHLHGQAEAYYHSIFIAACVMAGVPIEAEVNVSMGRADAILQSPAAIYVIEFKINQSVEVALKQIADKRYTEAYLSLGKPVIAVGVSFSSAERKIVEWRAG